MSTPRKREKVTSARSEMGIARHHVRLVREKSSTEPTEMRCPAQVARGMWPVFRELDREMFAIVALDVRNRMIGWHEVSVGTLVGSMVSPREVFKYLLLVNAASGVLIHNHPSGVSAPSREDREVTTAMVAAGRTMDVPIVDHVIVGDKPTGFFSFNKEGLL